MDAIEVMEARRAINRVGRIQTGDASPDSSASSIEKRLGFNSFGAFAAAAEKAGIVVRVKTDKEYPAIKATRVRPKQRDGEHLPEGATEREPRLRADFWHAFVDWRSELTRAYDRKKDRAIMFPAAAQVGEDPKLTELRASVAEEKERFIMIVPISMQAQYEWIADFIAAHKDHPLTVALNSTLKQDRPVRAFSQVIRADPTLAQEWRRSRLARVAAIVTQWIGEHGLSVHPWARVSVPDRASLTDGEGSGGLGRVDDEGLRALIHAAVDRMPAAELLRLSIPLEYLALHK